MFSFKKKKSAVGIDIGSRVTKVAQLSFSSTGHPAIERCDIIQTGLLDEGFEGNLKAYIKENKMTGAPAASSLEDGSMKIRKMELPKMPDLELIEAIKWNLRDIVDGNIDDFAVNFSRIKEDASTDEPKIILTAYAVKKEAVREYQNKIESIGLQAFFIEPSAVTLASTLERCHGEDDSYIAGVDVGYKHALFFIVGKGVFVFSRPLIGINLEAQEKERDNCNQKLAIEIQKSIDTFKVNFKMADVKKIFLSGGGALLPGITDYLKTNLGVETNHLNPFVNLSNVEPYKEMPYSLCAEAIGLAYIQP
ncbi:MAG: pilus assembly protein PilM [Deltaproteobacteria bacterium]|nr:pilus assembly protein PilM [Deltaproteobacteria bacterium]